MTRKGKPIFRYRNLSYEQRSISRDAVDYVLGKFCPRMQQYITVHVHGVKNMLDLHHEYGNCEYIDDTPYQREFKITIAKELSMPIYIRTLMHELVHVKQYAKGEMKHFVRTHKYIKWRGEKVDTDTVPYWEQPWEIEAHGREEGLTQMFMNKFPQWESMCDLTFL